MSPRLARRVALIERAVDRTMDDLLDRGSWVIFYGCIAFAGVGVVVQSVMTVTR